MSPPEALALKLPQAGQSRDFETLNGRIRIVDRTKDRFRAPERLRKEVTTSSLLTDEEYAPKSELVIIPSTEEELRSAIDVLEKSTTGIERRTAALSARQDHARFFTSNHEAINARRAGHVDRVGQRQAAELQHVKFLNAQLYDSLHEDAKAELGRAEKEVKSVHVNISALLNSDDRALAELNELSSSVGLAKESEVDIDALQQRVDKLTDALQHFRAEALKDRLDRVYLDALPTADAQGSGTHSAGDVLTTAIEEDLNSLYAEIDDMVAMVVAHDHRNGLGVALQSIRQSQLREKRTANEKIYGRLRSLTTTLEDVSIRLETLKHRRYDLHDLQTQLLQFEGGIPSRKVSSSVAVRVDQKDTNTATDALLHHLSLPIHPCKPAGIPDVNAHLRDATIVFEQRSLDSIAEMLWTTEQAAIRGRAALGSVSNALAANESNPLAVSALEEGINIAKAGIEAETTR
ncbi:hypothetical protein H2200_005162 [Cladophialophora chaetospira]|uniref:Uncharacterized protein n=1 Tax=Cladophialophora chaetospira TaxID=386627 RepID=A0AA38XBH0_9EURO|nr:hypothetical protein H2200_005162 [Cladophialophora chaetospira]